MAKIKIPYGHQSISCEVDDARFSGFMNSSLTDSQPVLSGAELVKNALDQPIASSKLCDLAVGKRNIVLITSDHTRPVPSKIITPLLLEEIRRGNSLADITILVGTGCHRETTKEELLAKFGEDIIAGEEIVIHDCDASKVGYLGQAPSGADIYVNELALKADLLVAEGLIEPHFFAGFSGGSKSVMTGLADRSSVLENHNAEFIAHPAARTGIMEGNPIQKDIQFAGRKANLAFICNVVINASKEIVYAVAGDCIEAHSQGCQFVRNHFERKNQKADIVITSNGGYPLDQNVYQAVKGMTAAEAAVNQGGVIIMVAQSSDGIGGSEFYRTFAEEKTLAAIVEKIRQTPAKKTRIDQWQSQILARVLQKARVVYVSEVDDELIENMHLVPAHSLPEALDIAQALLKKPAATVSAIPDGVSMIIKPD